MIRWTKEAYEVCETRCFKMDTSKSPKFWIPENNGEFTWVLHLVCTLSRGTIVVRSLLLQLPCWIWSVLAFWISQDDLHLRFTRLLSVLAKLEESFLVFGGTFGGEVAVTQGSASTKSADVYKKAYFPQTNMDTQNCGLEKVTPFKHGRFLVSILKFCDV